MDKPLDKDGILLVNKPIGITSHDVVDMVRRKLGLRRVGHAGTLDPLAEGLLVVLVGKSTRLFNRFVGFDKEYLGVMKLGESTSTGDSQGQVIRQADCSHISETAIAEVFALFKGETQQVPPMVSALRIKGQRLYKLARKGIEVERKPRAIKIYSLDILKVSLPLVEFKMRCSKGTYVRKFAEDAGAKLGCGAHMVSIKRLGVGPFNLDQAVSVEAIDETSLRKIPL
jgi:tRNA pseudouridine55 synthase